MTPPLFIIDSQSVAQSLRNPTYFMAFHFGAAALVNRRKVEMGAGTRIGDACANALVLPMRNEELAGPTWARGEGLVTFAVGGPIHVAFTAQTFTSAGGLAELEHLTFPARSFCIKLEALACAGMEVDYSREINEA